METVPQTAILVAEDDKAALDVLCMMIRTKFPGSAVYAAEDGRMGLDLFKQYAPGIVITDVSMPVMSGMEMAREIRAASPGTRIIVLTAHEEQVCSVTTDAIGISAYITKPVEFKRLFAVLEGCVAEIARAQRQV